MKRVLSSQHQARVEIESLADGHDFSETLTRARFEEVREMIHTEAGGGLVFVVPTARFDHRQVLPRCWVVIILSAKHMSVSL